MAYSSRHDVSTLQAFVRINRLEATVGYNLAYLCIGVGLGMAAGATLTATVLWYGVAVFLVKMHASVADAIHDRAADAANPEKSLISRAVETIGIERAWSIMTVELILGLFLFGYVSVSTGNVLYLAAGTVLGLLGFWYSYPPRLKERGAINHFVTTGTDVGVAIFPVAYLLVGEVTSQILIVCFIVFCYSFAYHLLHQAADTYYDRRAGLSTFTTRIGVPRTILLAIALTAVGGVLSAVLGLFVTAAVLVGTAVVYGWLYDLIRDEDEQSRTALLSQYYSIAWVAVILNASLAVELLLFVPNI